MTIWKKRKEGDFGLDILTEVKEPFSFANFYEERVVKRAKAVKKFLEEKGILFFLLSPFQQRNRLIVQLVVIASGVVIGIVPRSMSLLNAAKERNAASEMAALVENGASFTFGSIRVKPLASSQYDRQHLLAFYVTGNAGSVPSVADRYDVKLSASRGVSHAQDVSYAYDVVPVSEKARLLLVYVDNRGQDDATGIYDLTARLSNEDLSPSEIEPIEVVLSDSQATTELFDENGVDLAILTEGVLNDDRTPIADAKDALSSLLFDYELEIERIKSLPVALTPRPSAEELKKFVESSLVYGALADDSTTKDIAKLEEPGQEGKSLSLAYPATIEMDGAVFGENPTDADAPSEVAAANDPENGSNGDGALSEKESLAYKELGVLQGKVDEVLRAAANANRAALSKYQTLREYELMLNRAIDVGAFPKTGTVEP